MRLLRRAKDPTTFERMAADFAGPAHYWLAATDVGRCYYRAVNPDAVEHSFALVDGDRMVALVECDVHQGELTRFGMPIEMRFAPEFDAVAKPRAVRDCLAEIERLVKSGPSQLGVTVRTSAALDPDGILTSNLTGAATPTLELRAEVDLSVSEETLVGDMRKGHRQQVRWGEQNLSIRKVDRDNPDLDAMDRFREFHAAVAGRTTRSRESWVAMSKAIHEGRGCLVLGELDGKLVAGTLVLDAGRCAYYASGVYDRTQFDKPLAHYTLLYSILAAKIRGLRYFDVGHVPLAGDGSTAKEQAIGHFKHGFTSRMRSSLVWRRALIAAAPL